jgi:hypothetical protein
MAAKTSNGRTGRRERMIYFVCNCQIQGPVHYEVQPRIRKEATSPEES